jgi:hypothetical protein
MYPAACRDPGGGDEGSGVMREWVLQEGEDPDSGKPVLVDPESQLVYTWNKVGRRASMRTVVENRRPMATSATSDMYELLTRWNFHKRKMEHNATQKFS